MTGASGSDASSAAYDAGVPKSTPRTYFDRVSALGHAADAVMFDGETWKIICSCSWECWDQPTDEHAWELFNDHVYDDVGTSLRRLRHNAKVVTL